jgi:pilus assembly protein CpaE
VDCGSSFDEPTIAALEMADAVIVVCTPELNTLRDVRECQRVFGEIIRLDMKRICFVFNHNQPFAVLAREQFEAALEQSMQFELPHAGEAAYKAANRGEPLVLANAGCAYSKAVERIRRTLVPAEAKVAPKRRLNVIGRGSAPKRAETRPAGGLLAVLRGKRAS